MNYLTLSLITSFSLPILSPLHRPLVHASTFLQLPIPPCHFKLILVPIKKEAGQKDLVK